VNLQEALSSDRVRELFGTVIAQEIAAELGSGVMEAPAELPSGTGGLMDALSSEPFLPWLRSVVRERVRAQLADRKKAIKEAMAMQARRRDGVSARPSLAVLEARAQAREGAVSALDRHRALMPAEPVERRPAPALSVLEARAERERSSSAAEGSSGWAAQMRAKGFSPEIIESLGGDAA
jgi:hypothetical protein